jgi:hypothetical protein
MQVGGVVLSSPGFSPQTSLAHRFPVAIQIRAQRSFTGECLGGSDALCSPAATDQVRTAFEDEGTKWRITLRAKDCGGTENAASLPSSKPNEAIETY